jgi:putative transcriptional regulator
MSFLKGQLLIAMPGLPDDRFAGTVSLVCYHNENGAMGLILNRVIGTLRPNQFLENLKSDLRVSDRTIRVHLGGPVGMGRGFILHDNGLLHQESQAVDDHISVNGTEDALVQLLQSEKSIHWRFALGCASWSPGQIEEELRAGAWVTTPATMDLVFADELPLLWEKAMKAAGIPNPAMLVSNMGRA